MKSKKDTQDIRIRAVPTELVRRFRSVLVGRGITLFDWFLIEAAKTADEGNRK